MTNDERERIIADATKTYSGVLIRGVEKTAIVPRMLSILPNKVLVAITGVSKAQISKYKADPLKTSEEVEDAIFSFYKEVSEIPLDLDSTMSNQLENQSSPLYTAKEARIAYNDLRDCLKEIDYIVNSRMKTSVGRFRELRDDAPKKL